MANYANIMNRAAEVFTRFEAEWSGITAIYLQTLDEDTGQYESIYTVTGSWFFDNTDVNPTGLEDAGARENSLIYIAKAESGLATAFESATHILIGSRRYVINRPDLKSPDLITPWWKVYCDHEFV